MKITLLPKYLPQGYEDKTNLDVGFKTSNETNPDLPQVNAWRSRQSVFYEHDGVWFYCPITCECSPVDMEDAKPAGPFTLSATGRAREKWSMIRGDYSLTGEEHRDRPVYRNSGGFNLHSLEDGRWAVDLNLGDSQPIMRSTSPFPSPALCQHWQYLDGGKYNHGDITVTFNKTK